MSLLLPILLVVGLGVAAGGSSRRRPTGPAPMATYGQHQNLYRFRTVEAFVEYAAMEDELEAQGTAFNPVWVIYSEEDQPELGFAHEALLELADQNPDAVWAEVPKDVFIEAWAELTRAPVEDVSIPGSIIIVPGPHMDRTLEVEPGAPADAIHTLVNDVFDDWVSQTGEAAA